MVRLESEIQEVLAAKDTKDALQRFKNLEEQCSEKREMYQYWPLYLAGLKGQRSCNRARGFKLIMKTVKWDKQQQLDKYLPEILAVLDDEKSITVRQCIPYLRELLEVRPELRPLIIRKLEQLELSKYKESMQSLIARDIANLLEKLGD
ncbi:hypothetical protein [Enterococcus pallens]|uniref:Uncharacterized protein n=1 Tax=Enterococcus pallens ATCC BAA-351 TaxID=1158607 RepID=R2T5J5_9ENTE|nr:hypothetical protein UAU_01466 [Enterococcus pallens ATCC BAA-351]EOU21359.1 hypothetical protein I588_02206 [Enterococcus pallens ATCC BAA-351]OJG78752.1 hypothetical protein RV10_GL001238 [Enterococcus pallens]